MEEERIFALAALPWLANLRAELEIDKKRSNDWQTNKHKKRKLTSRYWRILMGFACVGSSPTLVNILWCCCRVIYHQCFHHLVTCFQCGVHR